MSLCYCFPQFLSSYQLKYWCHWYLASCIWISWCHCVTKSLSWNRCNTCCYCGSWFLSLCYFFSYLVYCNLWKAWCHWFLICCLLISWCHCFDHSMYWNWFNDQCHCVTHLLSLCHCVFRFLSWNKWNALCIVLLTESMVLMMWNTVFLDQCHCVYDGCYFLKLMVPL